MTITDEQLDEKRKRNAEAAAELKRIEAERVERETGLARQQSADHLDAEYKRIQAAIARARALSGVEDESADEEPVVEPEPTEPAPAPVETKPVAVPKPAAPKSNGAIEGAEAPGEGK